jgi:peptidoglycan hydrolase-like protein with peptidoglycan-binding domain
VIKIGSIVPICFVVAAGCTLSDSHEMANESPAVSIAVVESESRPVAPASDSAQPEAILEIPPEPARSLTNHEIRRLQTRLREIGFDPGPVDGVAGARTKAAYLRLHTGCSKIGPLLERFPAPDSELRSGGSAAGDKLPGRQDTQKIQAHLRSAGFDPGPVDGIFGGKTRSALAQFQNGCLMAKEFEAMLDDSWRTAANETSLERPSQRLTFTPKSQAVENSPQIDRDQQGVVVRAAGAREEVRILQLRLRDAGFDPGPFDGMMGPKTKAALEKYEASQRNQKTKASLVTRTIGDQY